MAQFWEDSFWTPSALWVFTDKDNVIVVYRGSKKYVSTKRTWISENFRKNFIRLYLRTIAHNRASKNLETMLQLRKSEGCLWRQKSNQKVHLVPQKFRLAYILFNNQQFYIKSKECAEKIRLCLETIKLPWNSFRCILSRCGKNRHCFL